MLVIPAHARQVVIAHAESTYPRECCGALVGSGDSVTRALPLENVYNGPQHDRYEIRPEDLLRVEQEARAAGESLLAIYHSHPDCAAYFSKTDLENSCPWYRFVVVSIQQGRFDHARCFQPDADLSRADEVPLEF
jgi:proteasome lid subunit RPN8/RPN11